VVHDLTPELPLDGVMTWPRVRLIAPDLQEIWW